MRFCYLFFLALLFGLSPQVRAAYEKNTYAITGTYESWSVPAALYFTYNESERYYELNNVDIKDGEYFFKIIAKNSETSTYDWWSTDTQNIEITTDGNKIVLDQKWDTIYGDFKITNPGSYSFKLYTSDGDHGNPNKLEVTKNSSDLLYTPFPTGMTLYFKPNADFEKDNAVFQAVFNNGITLPIEYNALIRYYSCTVPEGATYVRIQRGFKNGEQTNWVDNLTQIMGHSTANGGNNNCIVMANNVDNWTAAKSSWQVYTTITGMPFYPKGVTNESQFKALDPNEKFYYLTGHGINYEFPTPEWQLLDEDEDGIYTMDFTFADHTDQDCQKLTNHDVYGIYVTYYTRDSGSPTKLTNTYVSLQNYIDGALWRKAGLRLRATFRPNADGEDILKIDYIDAAGKVTNKENAFYTPFISFIGDSWLQEETVPRHIFNIKKDEVNNYLDYLLTGGWERGWIQYDEDGNPIISRDGRVFSNTQWPPINAVMFTTNIEIDNVTVPLGLSSDDLTFTSSGEKKTLVDWRNDDRFKHDTKFRSIPTDKYTYEGYYQQGNNVNFNWSKERSFGDDISYDPYTLYEVDNLWITGKFKMWTGWVSERTKNTGDGSQWSWNWGHAANNTSDEFASLTQFGDKNFKGYIFLGTQNGDASFDGIHYYPKVYFFYNHNSPNDNGDPRCFLYFKESYGGVQISALSHLDEYKQGMFSPNAFALNNVEITDVKIEYFKSSDKYENVLGVVADYTDLSITTNEAFRELFNRNYTKGEGKNPSSYFNDSQTYEESGWYNYKMTVTFRDGVTEVVYSNPYYIKGTATLKAYQLVQKKDDKKYYTYSSTSNTVYEVTIKGNKEATYKAVTISNPKDFYSNRVDWTNEVLLVANAPTTDGEELSSISWTFNGKSELCKGGDFAYVTTAAHLNNNNYIVKYSYTINDGSVITNDDEPATVNKNLRVPTPRLMQGYEVRVDDVEESTDLTVDSFRGASRAIDGYHVADEKATNYEGARLRSLSIKANLEMPNATQALLDLTPEVNGGLLPSVIADRIGSDRTIIYNGNLNLKTKTGFGNILYENQNIMNWVQNTKKDQMGVEKYEPIVHTLALTYTWPQNMQFYQRDGATVQLQLNPDFKAPALNVNSVFGTPESDEVFDLKKGEITGFRYFTYEDNKVYERLLLKTLPNLTDYEAKIGEGENAKLPITPANAYYAFGVSNGGDKVLVGTEGINSEAASLIGRDYLTQPSTSIPIQTQEIGHWWNGIEQTQNLTSFQIGIGHSYFFHVTDRVGFSFPNSTPATNAPQRVDALDDSKVVAFVPVLQAYNVDIVDVVYNNKEVPTGIDDVNMQGDIVAGDGFVDMRGNDGKIYSVDGRLIYTGNGRVALSGGVYIVVTSRETIKVIVK